MKSIPVNKTGGFLYYHYVTEVKIQPEDRHAVYLEGKKTGVGKHNTLETIEYVLGTQPNSDFQDLNIGF